MNPEIPQTFKQIREAKRATTAQKLLKSNREMIRKWNELDATYRGMFITMGVPKATAERGR